MPTPPPGYPQSGGVPGRQSPGSTTSGLFSTEDTSNFVAPSDNRAPGFNFVTQQSGSGYSETDVQAVFSWTPNDIFTLQRQLQAGGWITGDIDQPGTWDQKSQTAFRDLLQNANGLGVYYKDALSQSIQAYDAASGLPGIGGRNGSSGSGGALSPLTVQLPNEADVRKAVEQVARDETNVDLGEAFYAHVTSQYLDMLRTVQLNQGEAARRADHAASTGADPGVLTSNDPESLQTFAENAIETEKPGLVRTAGVGDAEAEVVDAFSRSYG